jgi:type IV pilus assembly protein PilM
MANKLMLKGKVNINLEALEGLFKPKTPPLIGTDISSSAIKMVEIAEASKGVYRVERYAVEPLH